MKSNNKRKKALHRAMMAFNKTNRTTAKASVPQLMPDFGTTYLKAFGCTPMTLFIAHPQVHVGEKEGNITWNANGHLGTLITTPDFARNYRQNPQQSLTVVPDQNDAYTTSLGERVVPFKLC